jgi:hypothetical protein
MPVTLDLETLIDWLGPAGAKAGLLESPISLKELIDLAKKRKLPLSPKPTREEVSNELVFANVKKIELSAERFLSMDQAEIVKYLKQVKPSRSEVIGMLESLGVHVGSEASKSLYAFVAREVSDMGMYQRVARGKNTPSDPK